MNIFLKTDLLIFTRLSTKNVSRNSDLYSKLSIKRLINLNKNILIIYFYSSINKYEIIF